MKFDDTTLIFQSMKPRNAAVENVARKALVNGKKTYQIFPKNR